MSRLPNFIVLGQGKAGTSLIYRTLARYPEIGLSDPKELHYFTAQYERGRDWYAQAFAHLPPETQLVGEVSPSYLDPVALPRILETLGPETKLIFVLRRPIERAYSRYLQNICARQKGPPFKRMAGFLPDRLIELVETLRFCYAQFGPDNILPLFYEDEISGPDPSFERRLLPFLGLTPQQEARAVLADGVPNPGVMPHYLYSGASALHVRFDTSVYVVPPHTLAFCGQPRSTTFYTDPPLAQVRAAFARQSRWSREVSEAEYAMLMRNAVGPASHQLEAEFGYDMSHWRIPPYRISYGAAPPPWQFRKKKKKKSKAQADAS